MTDKSGQPDRSGQVHASDAEREADVKVYVPDGVDVQLSGIAVMGDKRVMVREAPAGQSPPRWWSGPRSSWATSR